MVNSYSMLLNGFFKIRKSYLAETSETKRRFKMKALHKIDRLLKSIESKELQKYSN